MAQFCQAFPLLYSEEHVEWLVGDTQREGETETEKEKQRKRQRERKRERERDVERERCSTFSRELTFAKVCLSAGFAQKQPKAEKKDRANSDAQIQMP